jgi:hypothetical protein
MSASWLAAQLPPTVVAPDVHFHDRYYVLDGWIAAAAFMLALCIGVKWTAVHYHVRSWWVSLAAGTVVLFVSLHLLIIGAMWAAFPAPRAYRAFALEEGFQRTLIAALDSLSAVFSLALLTPLLAMLCVVREGVSTLGDIPSGHRRRAGQRIFAGGTVLCGLWAYSTLTSWLAVLPPTAGWGVVSAGQAVTTAVAAIVPIAATFALTRSVRTQTAASVWRWSHVASAIAITVVPIAVGGVFTVLSVLGHPAHMFFAIGALAIWIATHGERAQGPLCSTSQPSTTT